MGNLVGNKRQGLTASSVPPQERKNMAASCLRTKGWIRHTGLWDISIIKTGKIHSGSNS